jgi:hypothetical protein
VISRKLAIRFTAASLLAALILYVLFRNINLRLLGESIKRSSPWGLALAALVNLLQWPVRALRWQRLVKAGGESISMRSALEATVIGNSMSVALPGRLGEVAQPSLLALRERISLALSMGSFATTRVLDVLTVLAGFGIGLVLAAPSAWIASWSAIGRKLAYMSPLIAAGLLGGLVVASRWYLSTRQRSWAIRFRQNRIGRQLDLMTLGLSGLAQPKVLMGSLATSLATWLLISASTWIGLAACHVDLPIAAVLVLMPLLVIGIAVPTPAGVGGYHAAMAFGLVQLYSIDRMAAAGASILVHLVQTVPIVALALMIYLTGSRSVPRMDQLLDATKEDPVEDIEAKRQES